MPVELFGLCLRQGAGQRRVQQPRQSKPLIALSTATYWHPLRECGIEDKVRGFGASWPSSDRGRTKEGAAEHWSG